VGRTHERRRTGTIHSSPSLLTLPLFVLNCSTTLRDHDGHLYCPTCYNRKCGIKGYGYGSGAGTLATDGGSSGTLYVILYTDKGMVEQGVCAVIGGSIKVRAGNVEYVILGGRSWLKSVVTVTTCRQGYEPLSDPCRGLFCGQNCQRILNYLHSELPALPYTSAAASYKRHRCIGCIP
jgi:hypothetical protein